MTSFRRARLVRRRLNLPEPLPQHPPPRTTMPTEPSSAASSPTGRAPRFPGATVTIHNEATGVDTVLVTNAAGAYTSPPLVLGRYSVTVDLTGFKKAVSAGILLEGGDQLRQDMVLQVGGLNETVEVKSDAGLRRHAAGRQPHGEREVLSRPPDRHGRRCPSRRVRPADAARLPADEAERRPDVPRQPVQFPHQRRPEMATENFFDGAAFGYASGHQQSQESTPPVDSVQEVKVITTSYSAQYGHTSGGFIEYTAKSGTNAFHGSGYGYFADDAFNSKGFFAVGKTPLSNNDYGATLGGPVVIPKLYNGHNKTFFFGNFDYTRLRSGVLPGFGNTTPTDAFKAGDFGAAPDWQPDRHRCARAADFRRPDFQSGHDSPRQRRSGTRSLSWQHHPWQRSAAKSGGCQNRRPDGSSGSGRHREQRRRQPGGRPDVGAERAEHARPPGPQFHAEFQDERQLLLEPAALDPQLRRNRRVHDTVRRGNRAGEEQHLLRTRLLPAHLHPACAPAIRLGHPEQPAESHARWPGTGGSWAGILCQPASAGRSCCGAPTRAASCDNNAGPPVINFAGNIPYTNIGQNWQQFGYEKNNRWQFSNDLTWVKGRHTAKVGVEYRHHKFPSKGWGTSTGGNFDFNRLGTGGYDSAGNNLGQTGDPFASFLLGQVQQARPDHPGLSDVQRSVYGRVDQRRIQGQRHADADPGSALRLSVRPHRE